nr:TonB-dependent receptor [Chitinivorax tropicus]
MFLSHQKRVEEGHVRLKPISLALATAGLLTASYQTLADDAPKKAERIEVVGSSIKRINKEGPAPVVTIKRAEIEKTGATTVVELLGQLPVVSGFFTGDDNGSYAVGAAAASMRGLGSKNVLVLLNGRRIANYAFALGADITFVDLNSLPVSAIEQVEILKDGASAIYGSDAVAGVINFKTRRNYQGFEASVGTGATLDGDTQELSTNLTGGFGNLEEDGRNLLVTVDAYHREPTFSKKHTLTKSADRRKYGGADGRATNIFPGSFMRFDEAPFREAMPGCPADRIATDDRGDTYCRYESADFAQLQPRATRTTVAALYNQKLGSDTQLFAELALNRNVTDYDTGYRSIETGTSHMLAPGDAAYRSEINGITNSKRLQVFRAVYEAGISSNKTTSDMSRGLIGIRSTFGNWDLESALYYSKNKITSIDYKQLLKDKVLDAYFNGGYDPFAAWNPDELVRPLLTDVHREATSEIRVADVKMSNGELFKLGEGSVGFAWGASTSKEKMADIPDAQLAANNIENWGGTRSEGDRKLHSIYGEFSLTPIKQLEIQLAARHDRYSDFGGTTNPKLAMLFKPSDQVLVRGGITTSFKAPTLPQLYMKETKSFNAGVADWVRCRPLKLTKAQCVYFPEEKLVGNKDLQAEKSKNMSFGIALQPTQNLYASLDWFRILQRDTVQLLDAQYMLDNEDKDPALARLIERDPRNKALEARFPGLERGRLFRMLRPYRNVGRTDVEGYDLELRYDISLGEWGKLTLRDDFNNLLHLEQSTVEDGPTSNRVGGYDTPRWRNAFTITYSNKAWDGSLKAKTVARTLDVSDPRFVDPSLDGQVGAYTIFDANFNYRGIRSLTLNAGIKNLFNKTPPFLINLDSFAGATTDRIGRIFYANARYQFK